MSELTRKIAEIIEEPGIEDPTQIAVRIINEVRENSEKQYGFITGKPEYYRPGDIKVEKLGYQISVSGRAISELKSYNDYYLYIKKQKEKALEDLAKTLLESGYINVTETNEFDRDGKVIRFSIKIVK